MKLGRNHLEFKSCNIFDFFKDIDFLHWESSLLIQLYYSHEEL